MSRLLGKIIIQADIEIKTGMRIGGTGGGLKIGGVDLNVITDPWGRPYIPGSSLKGKMRSLMEKKEGVGFDRDGSHMCRGDEEYTQCPICKIWGVLAGKNFSVPTLTRLLVRDTFLDEASITEEMRRNLDLQWTEVKFETAIDRLKGTAKHGSLRQAERVPAGAVFRDCEMVFNVFEEADKDLLLKVFEALKLVEHDYLGGMGSRGYGQVAFRDVRVYRNRREDYESGDVELTPERRINGDLDTPAKLLKRFEQLKAMLA